MIYNTFSLWLYVAIALSSVVSAADVLRAHAWRSKAEYPEPSDFPELKMDSVKSRPNTAIAFTGGGSRSFLASIGYLAGLNELGLIPNIRYISGISGGSWATLAYTFSQLNVSEQTLLGKVLLPEELTLDKLKEMDSQCLRSVTAVDFVGLALHALKDGTVSSLADSWAYATQKTYFEPFGITAGAPLSWDASTVADIKARNPALKDVPFVVPGNAKRPFPMVGTGIVGPSEADGYKYDTRNFTMLEINPLYTGQMRTIDVEYTYHKDKVERKHIRRVGGAVETYAFGRYGAAPASGLLVRDQADLDVPMPTSFLDAQFSGGASSYAPGAFVESLTVGELADKLGLHMDYWSPADALPESKDTLFCDGGSYENIMVPSMLQRRVEKMVLFFNMKAPLQPSSQWNVATDEPSSSQVSDTLSSLFGVVPPDSLDYTWQKRSFDNTKNQFWTHEDYVEVITGLQKAQERGNGIIYTKNLTSIKNDWWGVPAGVTTQVTFVYLGRLKTWESKLNRVMRGLLVPHDDADEANLAEDINHGPFKSFPHYLTAGGLIDHERANALSDLTGWTILQNAELFRSIFSA